MAEIYQALTLCREGEKFFERCNMLLQLYSEEHLCNRPGYLNCGMTGLKCIEKNEEWVKGYDFPEGTKAWHDHL